jgi:S-adenosylmethionine synthetase
MVKKKKEKIQTYKANKILQQKIGRGPLDLAVIEKAQKAIENNKVDFAPLGLQFLTELEEALTNVEKTLNEDKFEKQKQSLTGPVMELKANATTFHFNLVGNLANIMLSFLESIKKLDKDALAIVRAHHDTLKGIITKKMKGDGGKEGQVFIRELEDACARYHKKNKKKQDD